MKLLVVYATTDGMAAHIAERIGETARAAGIGADVLNAAALPKEFDPSRYDGILVGASMHVQGYQHAARRFVRRYRDALGSRPSGFFSVCLSILSTKPAERAEARRIAEQFPARLGWKPEIVEIMAGALMFSRYGVLRRMAMKAIAKKEMGSVDARRDTVFTDWDAVDRFARGFVALLSDRTSKDTSVSASI